MRDHNISKREVKMSDPACNSTQPQKGWLALAILAILALICSCSSLAFATDKDKKKADAQPKKSILDMIDKSKLVWPQPPNITRVKYLDYFAGEKLPDFNAQATKNKSSWMDRLAGTANEKGGDPLKNHFFFGEPHGMAIDSKGKLYVADAKVGAIFVIDPET